MQRIDIDPPGRETDRRALNHHGVTGDLGLDHRQTLRKGVIRKLGRDVGPEEVGEIVAGELLPGIQREADQQGKMFARTKSHLLTRSGEEGRTTEAVQQKNGELTARV
jgi:hypothetical protein